MKHPLPGIALNPKLRIGDSWVSQDTRFPVINPATGESLASVPLGNLASVQQAVSCAQEAFQRSRTEPAHIRSARLWAFADAIEARTDTFTALIVAEAGKPVSLARAEVKRALTTFRLAAEEARHQRGGLLDLDATVAGAEHFGITRRFPIGPIAAISPFNFPLNLVAHKVAPALAAGNTIVLKPSPKTPLTALHLAEAADAAGLPAGYLNVITCPNEIVSSLVQDPRIRMLSFTGSDRVGKQLHRIAMGKRSTLELGGNAMAIVHADADIQKAAASIATGGFSYAGQTCISAQNVLVHASQYAEFRDALLSFIQSSVQIGDPWNPEVLLGPMIDPAAVERTRETVAKGIQSGAQKLIGGGVDGCFFEPTIFEKVPPTAPLWTEEIFAPVLCLASYESFEDALEQVNQSRYGLQTGVFTRDFALAWKAFESLEVGAVLINEIPTWRVENMPYGGTKDSGLGREGVSAAIEEMTESRSWIWKTIPIE